MREDIKNKYCEVGGPEVIAEIDESNLGALDTLSKDIGFNSPNSQIWRRL